jgi:hypothetical protein
MSVLLALAACGGVQSLVSTTYNTSQTITIPAGVSTLALVSGQGAAGQPEFSYFVRDYTKKTTIYNRRNDLGGQVVTLDGGTTYGNSGIAPANYCTAESPYQGNGGVYNYTWTCYDFTDTSHYEVDPATTGSSATGFGKTFPGGTGGPASSTSFNNVAVTPGAPYNLVIPAGGSITISYYQ